MNYGDHIIEKYSNNDKYALIRNDIDLLDKNEFNKKINQLHKSF